MIAALVIAWLTIALPWAAVLLRALQIANAEGIGMAEFPARYRARLALQMIGAVCCSPFWGWLFLRAMSKHEGSEEFRVGLRRGYEIARSKASRYQPILPDEGKLVPKPPPEPTPPTEAQLAMWQAAIPPCQVCGERPPPEALLDNRVPSCSCVEKCAECGLCAIKWDLIEAHAAAAVERERGILRSFRCDHLSKRCRFAERVAIQPNDTWSRCALQDGHEGHCHNFQGEQLTAGEPVPPELREEVGRGAERALRG